MTSIQSREATARRRLAMTGFRLHKTPARSYLRWHGAGYMISEEVTNTIVFGCWRRQYEATLAEIETFTTNANQPAPSGQ